MKEILINHLCERYPQFKEYEGEGHYFTHYIEDVNEDALTDEWLNKGTSYIYKVGVFAAIDSNKCDYLHIVIGTQRDDVSTPEIKGYFYFSEGENDDVARVMSRAMRCLERMHPVFEQREEY
jgi:hypothetical protein